MKTLTVINRKWILLALLIALIILSYLLTTDYRDYIYKNGINDFGLADVGYNIFAVTTLSLSSWIGLFKITDNKIIGIAVITAGYLLLEVLSGILPFIGTYDTMDLLALLFSGGITIMLLFLIDSEAFRSDFSDVRTYFGGK
ncbi:MAG: hypothetical protein AAF717_17800 [Bacteroidota bacterium]